MKIILITLHFMLSNANPLNVYLLQDSKQTFVYQNGQLTPDFDDSIYPPLSSCTPSPIFECQNDNDATITNIQLKLQNLSPYTVELTSITNVISQSSMMQIIHFYILLRDLDISLVSGSKIIQSGQTTTYLLKQRCQQDVKIEENNYWSSIEIILKFDNYSQIDFTYQFTCEKNYFPINFDWSLVILLIFSSIIVTLLAKVGKILSIRIVLKKDSYTSIYFQGFQLNFWFILVYMAIFVLTGLSAVIYPEYLKYGALTIITAIGIICTWFILNELMCRIPLNFGFQINIYKNLRICDILSFILTALIIGGYFLLKRAWYMNNIIAVCIIGFCIKIFKITSLKNAVVILLPCVILDIISIFLNYKTETQSYDLLILKYFNYPVELQIPLFVLQFNKRCSWVSIVDIILPGLVISYNMRYDTSRNTKVYQVNNLFSFYFQLFSFLGLMLGAMIWMTVTTLVDHNYPMSIFTYVLMISFSLILAQKRGEFTIIWEGLFYDVVMLNPYYIRSKSSVFRQKVIQTLKCSQQEEQIMQLRLHNLIKKNIDQTKNKSKYKLDESLFQGLIVQNKTGPDVFTQTMYEESKEQEEIKEKQ